MRGGGAPLRATRPPDSSQGEETVRGEPRKTLFYLRYAMGNFANTIAYQVFGNRIQFYYVDILGLNAAVAGIIWTLYGFWNAVNDPLMGQISDRTRSRMGRRVPYVLFGAIPLGLSFFFLWTPPGRSPAVLAAYFFLILFIFDGLYSLTWIAYTSLFPEIATTVRGRVNLSAARRCWRSSRCSFPTFWRPSWRIRWGTSGWGPLWARWSPPGIWSLPPASGSGR